MSVDAEIRLAVQYQHEILLLKDRIKKQEDIVARLLKENGILRDHLAGGIAPNKQVAKIRTLQQEVTRTQSKLAKVNAEKPPATPARKVPGEIRMLRSWYPPAT